MNYSHVLYRSPDWVCLCLVQKLRFLSAVISESLRLFPPGHIISRIAAQDQHVGNFSVPAGTWLHVCQEALRA